MNIIKLTGIIASKPTITHYYNNEKFYTFQISTKRTSGTVDIINVVVSSLMMKYEYTIGSRVYIQGDIRTRHTDNLDKKKEMYIFAHNIQSAQDEDFCFVELTGKVVQKSDYRTTPKGRTLVDFMVDVDRSCNRHDYIPCIAWNRTGLTISNLEQVHLTGRLQSRQYVKAGIQLVTHEISISEVVNEVQSN